MKPSIYTPDTQSPRQVHSTFRAAVGDLLLELLRVDPGYLRELVDVISGEAIIASTEALDSKQFATRRRLDRDTVTRMAREGRIVGAEKDGREWRLPADAKILPVGHKKTPTFDSGEQPHKRSPQPSSGALEAMLDYSRLPEAAS